MSVDLTTLLKFAKEQGASDLHISAGMSPMVRIRGDMVRINMPALSRDEAHTAIVSVMTDEQKKVYEQRRDVDFALELRGVSRFRANVLQQQRGPAAVFRVIPSQVIPLDQLELPKAVKDLASREKGLVLVTGPTGSGKSTTLASMVDYVNEHLQGHILTIEDPIEFVHESKRCLVNQREIGQHTESFASALRAGLREDPDVILVGELRDLETTQLAISAAETGHLVFATLHTNSASKTIDRVIDVFPPEQQGQIRSMLSESLEGVITQKLLPSKDGKGRVAALEILIAVPAIRNLIRENKTPQIVTAIQTGAQHGMQSLDQALRDLVMQGKLAREEAIRHGSGTTSFEAPPGAAGAKPGAPAAKPGGPARPAAPRG